MYCDILYRGHQYQSRQTIRRPSAAARRLTALELRRALKVPSERKPCSAWQCDLSVTIKVHQLIFSPLHPAWIGIDARRPWIIFYVNRVENIYLISVHTGVLPIGDVLCLWRLRFIQSLFAGRNVGLYIHCFMFYINMKLMVYFLYIVCVYVTLQLL